MEPLATKVCPAWLVRLVVPLAIGVPLAIAGPAGCGQVLGIDDPRAHDAGMPDGDDDPASCDDDQLACGGACVDPDSSPDHCGRCDHGCRPGTCLDGTCQPFLIGTFDGPGELAATATEVYVSQRDGVVACPVPAGCGDEPRRVADGFTSMGELAVAGGRVFFSGFHGKAATDHRVYQCPTTGCPAEPVALATGARSFTDFAVAGDRIYWRLEEVGVSACTVDACAASLTTWPEARFGADVTGLTAADDTIYVGTDGDLRTCPAATGCGDPGTIADTARVRPDFRVHGGLAYWLALADPLLFIFRCPLDDCEQTSQVVQDTAGVKWLEVDDTGLYWLNDVSWDIRYCPPTGCSTEPDGTSLIGDFRDMPVKLVLGPGYLYWIEGNSVLAAARP